MDHKKPHVKLPHKLVFFPLEQPLLKENTPCTANGIIHRISKPWHHLQVILGMLKPILVHPLLLLVDSSSNITVMEVLKLLPLLPPLLLLLLSLWYEYAHFTKILFKTSSLIQIIFDTLIFNISISLIIFLGISIY